MTISFPLRIKESSCSSSHMLQKSHFHIMVLSNFWAKKLFHLKTTLDDELISYSVGNQPSQLFCKNLICILWFLMNLVCTIHFSTNYGSWVLTISFLLRIKKTLGYSSNMLQKSCLHIMVFVKCFGHFFI